MELAAGARAQWLSSEIIIFNIYDKKSAQYRAMLVEPSTNEHHVLPISVQEADRNGRVYSISFEALAAIRPDYGYRNKEWTDQDILENRIRSYDTNSGRVREFVGVQELLIEAKERHGDSISLPKLNHVMASPSGKNLIFLFRYFVHGHRITDLYVLEVATGAWRCLVGNRGVSHSHWLDDTTIITTMQGEQGFGYYWIDIVTGTTELVWRQSDGHPSPLGKRGFVTDTYPDNKAVRGLFMVPWDDPANCWMLGRFPEPLLFLGETRCDLHPVTSPSARWIQIDLALGHQRRVGVLPVPKWGS